ncbi:MAG: outer membrane lipoprotein-sorting protein [bacterium]|nr:outer membrane lipoprotein-sorting protein [bacterium]
MRWRITLFFIVLIASVPCFASETNKGYEIMKAQKEQNIGFHDEKSVGRIELVSRNLSKVTRSFHLSVLEGSEKAPEKSLYKITSPQDLKGVGLLFHVNKEKGNDQWLYLPATNKTKRIAGSLKSGRFVGSEFTYEDLSTQNLEDYDYIWMREEACGETLCDVITIVPHKGKSQYAKTVVWVSQKNQQTKKIDFYNAAGEIFKTAKIYGYKLYLNKYWRPWRIIMRNLKLKKESRLVIDQIELNTGLKDSDFTKAVLER